MNGALRLMQTLFQLCMSLYQSMNFSSIKICALTCSLPRIVHQFTTICWLLPALTANICKTQPLVRLLTAKLHLPIQFMVPVQRLLVKVKELGVSGSTHGKSINLPGTSLIKIRKRVWLLFVLRVPQAEAKFALTINLKVNHLFPWMLTVLLFASTFNSDSKESKVKRTPSQISDSDT